MNSIFDDARSGYAPDVSKTFRKLKAEVDCIESLVLRSDNSEDKKLVSDCEYMRKTIDTWLNMCEEESTKEGW